MDSTYRSNVPEYTFEPPAPVRALVAEADAALVQAGVIQPGERGWWVEREAGLLWTVLDGVTYTWCEGRLS